MKPRSAVIIRLGCIAVALLLWGSGCAGRSPAPGTPVEIDVDVREYSVSMSRLILPANTPLRFVITNHGVIAHAVMLERAGEANRPYHVYGREAMIGVIEPGQTETAVWVVDQPGEYQLACHIPGHYEGGMVQMFAVDLPGLPHLIAVAPTWFIIGMAGMLVVIVGCLAGLSRWRRFPLQSS